MALKLQPQPTFWTKVAIPVPGALRDEDIRVEFKHLPRDELREYLTSFDGRKDNEALAEVLLDWKDLDEPFSADALDRLLSNYPGSGQAILNKYITESSEAKTKNSRP